MATLYINDRDREVSYNGTEMQCNTYTCSDCQQSIMMARPKPDWCPYCGEVFVEIEDTSL
jgi:rubrerythrin